jgi:ribosomal protein S18 acetylase RimI-like enzyme
VNLIVADAARDDAVTLAILHGGDMVGVTVLRYPRWDREHFGHAVARIEHLQGTDQAVLQQLADGAAAHLAARGALMCSARLANDALGALHCLERAGFRYVELILAPWRDLSGWKPRRFGVTRPTGPEDLDRMCALARRAFRTDRFHRDLRFERAAADGVYEKWIRSWHAEQSPERQSLVLLVGDEVAGFLMFELQEPLGKASDVVARVVLNAVDPAHSGRGHGFRMYCDALDIASDVARFCTADVAAANPAVLNLYAKLGFQLTSSGDVTMHWWSQDQGRAPCACY